MLLDPLQVVALVLGLQLVLEVVECVSFAAELRSLDGSPGGIGEGFSTVNDGIGEGQALWQVLLQMFVYVLMKMKIPWMMNHMMMCAQNVQSSNYIIK